MFVGKCQVIYQFDDYLQELNTASSQAWHDNSSGASSITRDNIKLFIQNNYNLIVSHQTDLKESLLKLANRVEKEYGSDPKTREIANQIKHLTNIVPNEIFADILEKVGEGTVESFKILSRTSSASRSSYNESTKRMADYINHNQIPFSSIGLKKSRGVIALIQRLGPNLEYLDLDGRAKSMVFNSGDLAVILAACPNLKKLKLSNLDFIDDRSWTSINSLVNLEKLTIDSCDGIKNIPILTHRKLNTFHLFGQMNHIASPLPHCITDLLISYPFDPEQAEFDNPPELPALPNNLKKLCVHSLSCNNFPTLPNSLESIELYHLDQLALPAQWPTSLQSLSIRESVVTTPVQNLPDMKQLVIEETLGLTNQFILPNRLETLYLDNTDILTLHTLPINLKELTFLSSQGQITIPNTLPPKLEVIQLSKSQHTWEHIISQCNTDVKKLYIHDPSLVDFNLVLPEHITILHLELPECTRFQIPDFIKSLIFTHCYKLAEVPPLPVNLESLQIYMENSPNITLTNMPHLKLLVAETPYLCIDNCPKLLEQMKVTKLQTAPTYLIIKNDPSLVKLENLFANPFPLNHLELINCPNLTSLTNLAGVYPNVFYLNVSGSGLKMIENISFLYELNIHQCTELESLDCSGATSLAAIIGEFPNSLRNLNLSDCHSLTVAPALPKSLTTLNVRNVKSLNMIWSPEQFQKKTDLSLIDFPKNLDEKRSRFDIIISKNEDLAKYTPLDFLKATHILLQDNAEIENINFEIAAAFHLIITNCPRLNSVIIHSQSLKQVEIKNCPSIRTIDLSDCPILKMLNGKLPPNIEQLVLTNCENILIAPFELPRNLRNFDVSNVKLATLIWSSALIKNYERVNPQMVVEGYPDVEEVD